MITYAIGRRVQVRYGHCKLDGVIVGAAWATENHLNVMQPLKPYWIVELEDGMWLEGRIGVVSRVVVHPDNIIDIDLINLE